MTAKASRFQSGAAYTPRWQRILLYAILVAFAIFYLIPVYLLLITGLKSFAEVSLTQMWALPQGLHFDSFLKAWSGSKAEGFRGLGGNFLNSVYLTLPGTILSAMLGSINGYVLAKWKFKGSDLLFPLLLFGMFIPYQSILIPLVRVLSQIPWFGGSLFGTIPGLIFVHVVYGIPITTLIFRNYYAAIPTELVEAARINGAGIFGLYRHILYPRSLPEFV
ncbi:MAG: carbohydrate ABC transporter permease, partial [Caldilineae bacterium]